MLGRGQVERLGFSFFFLEDAMKRLTKKIKAEIIALRRKGLTSGEIAEILKIAEAKVVKVISSNY